MKRLLKMYVVNDLFNKTEIKKIKLTNQRFFPTKEVIRDHLIRARRRSQYSNIDLQNLEVKVTKWRNDDPDTMIHFRTTDGEEQTVVKEDDEEIQEDGEDELPPLPIANNKQFVFVYQSKWQRRLMARYKELICLDATYRTTKYTIPLFFLVVKTNVDYQIVATFVTANETKESIKEALEILKSWNPEFKPVFFMTDCCYEEILALEEVFPGEYISCYA